jgi:hypothetical protein
MPDGNTLLFLVLPAVAIAGFALLLGCLTGRVADRRLRLALPVILALVAGMTLASGTGAPVAVVLAISIIAAAGVVTPLPLFGGISDMFMGALRAGTPACDLAFSVLLWIGFYLECVLVAAALYFVLRTNASLRHECGPE